MRPITSLWIALASGSLLTAAERPRYGGELRIELRETLQSLEDAPDDLRRITGQSFETVAQISAGYTRDVARKQWNFTPRPGATWHDGRTVEPFSIADDKPLEVLLREVLSRKNSDGATIGTGPFRVGAFEPGKRLRLIAHTGHWGGRPYLDAIEIAFARSMREQALAFDVGAADVIETPWNETRRARQRPGRAVHSAFLELLALVFDASKVPQPVREAVALSLDRSSIHGVLLQKQGVPTAALLPQWLSGWAFAFPVLRNLEKARKVSASASLSFAYDRQDPLLRAIAERVALNASEAGITMKPATTAAADVRLMQLRISPESPAVAMAQLAAAFRTPQLEDAFTTERFLLEGSRIIPLFHLPATYYISSRVRNWQGDWVQSDRWNLADVWLREAKP